MSQRAISALARLFEIAKLELQSKEDESSRAGGAFVVGDVFRIAAVVTRTAEAEEFPFIFGARDVVKEATIGDFFLLQQGFSALFVLLQLFLIQDRGFGGFRFGLESDILGKNCGSEQERC